ncbi:hypothetical protein EPUL_002828, partial [Erysiphe pulchra]
MERRRHLADIRAGFYTRSLALVADAFHCLIIDDDVMDPLTINLLGTQASSSTSEILVDIKKLSEGHAHPSYLSFGWQRAQVLGAFFNAVFLLALGIGTFLQSIERFISLQRKLLFIIGSWYIKNAKLVLVIGSIGLTMNIVSSRQTSENSVSNPKHLHHGCDHCHNHGHDLGMMAIIAHMVGDAINNIGIIFAALVIWKGSNSARYYADPIVSTAIAIMILATAIPICKSSGLILLESAPADLRIDKVKIDLEKIPGVIAVHNLRVWSLNYEQTLASVCVLISDNTLEGFEHRKRLINECLSDYGVHFATIQPELITDIQLLKPFVISTPEEVAQLIPEVMKIA